MGNTGKRTLLVVEDSVELQSQLRWGLSDFEVLTAGDRQSALEQVRKHRPGVITLDLGLPPDADGTSEGIAALKDILSLVPNSKVIMVTGSDDRSQAVTAIGLGAYDYYVKPIDMHELKFIIERAYNVYDLELSNRHMAEQQGPSPLPGLIATSETMLKVCGMIEKVAPSGISAFLYGESGTGKELLARAIHDLSPRREGPMVAINCAAIPEQLLESELFGHEKGAFTGAIQRKIGKIERADGGTLFLDEIGDLAMPLQAKLLRFLQERCVERVGGKEEIEVDVRLVAATHQDLKKLIEAGRFREDLYYRLTQVIISVPPLRDRPGDAAAVAHSLFVKIARELGKPQMKLGGSALLAIENYSWPGNIRELENRLKQAAVISDNVVITADDLGLPSLELNAEEFSLALYRDRAERQALEKALTAVEGNISRASKMLKISRPTLYDLMQKHDFR